MPPIRQRGFPVFPALIVLFFLFLFGEVLVRDASISPAQFSPATWLHQPPPYHGWLENTPLNRFAPGRTPDRALWDRPVVNDPIYRAANALLARGEFPFLTPDLGLGVPLFANGVDSTFFVGNIAMYLLPPAYWDLLYLALFLLSYCLTYVLLARFYDLAPPAAFAGATVYLCSAAFAIILSSGGETFHVHLFTAIVLVDEALLRRLRDRRGTVLLGALTAVLLAQSAYAGMPEGTVAVFLMTFVYLLLRAFHLGLLRPVVAHAFVIYLAALLLAAPYLLTLFEYSLLMEHPHAVGHFTIDWTYLPDVVLPYLHGWTTNPFVFHQFPNHLYVAFVGPLALYAFVYWLGHRAFFPPGPSIYSSLVLVALVYVSQSYGSGPWTLNVVGHLPVLEKIFFFRFFACLFALAVAIVTTQALDRYIVRGARPRFLPMCGAATALLLVVVYLVLPGQLRATGQGALLASYFRWHRPTLVLLLFALALFALAAWPRAGGVASPRGRAAVVVVLALVLGASNYSRSFYRRFDPYAPTPMTAFLSDRLGAAEPFRAFASRVPFPSTAAGLAIPEIRYLVPIVPSGMLEVLRASLHPLGQNTIRWDRFEELAPTDRLDVYDHVGFDLLGVRYFVIEGPPLHPAHRGVREVYRDPRFRIYENTDALPRFRLLADWAVLPSRAALLRAIVADPARLRATALLLEPPAFPARLRSPDPPGDGPGIEVVRVHNDLYDLRVRSEREAILLLADTRLPGHRAWVDRREVPVLEVDGGLLGIALPAGTHHVIVRYRPRTWPLAIALCLATPVVLAGYAVAARARALRPWMWPSDRPAPGASPAGG